MAEQDKPQDDSSQEPFGGIYLPGWPEGGLFGNDDDGNYGNYGSWFPENLTWWDWLRILFGSGSAEEEQPADEEEGSSIAAPLGFVVVVIVVAVALCFAAYYLLRLLLDTILGIDWAVLGAFFGNLWGQMLEQRP